MKSVVVGAEFSLTAGVKVLLESWENMEVIGKPYITTHFLVPLKAENDFKVSIRTEANVVCLCPNCAAKLEYASDKERQEMLMLLYMKHNEQLREMGIDISLMELFKYYGMS